MIPYLLSHLAIAVSFLLTGYLGIKSLGLKGRYKSAGYGLITLSLGFIIRSVFDFYKLYKASYWLIPEGLLLLGIFILTYSITMKKDTGKTKGGKLKTGKGKIGVKELVKAGLIQENNTIGFFEKRGSK